ncbi:MAG: hypothetical protein ACRD1I_07230 [Terriglobia bacterium]
MEYGRQHGTRKSNHRVGENDADRRSAVAASALPNIAGLIDYGEITIGVVDPVGH